MSVQVVYDQEFSVLGAYDSIVVSTNSVEHSGRSDQGIGWLNQYAFNFTWCAGNDQIWVYNVDKIGFHQMCNQVPAGIINTVHKRLSCQGPAPFDEKVLGSFDSIIVHETTVNHCDQTRGITWINPKAFYFKWSEGNEQVWVYDENVDAYLQITMGANCVAGLIAHNSAGVHRRL